MVKSFTKPTELDATQMNSTDQRIDRRILAWAVHLYTATGLIAAAAIAVLIIRGDDASYRLALLLMIVATIIDSTDGRLARRVDVKRWTPSINGRQFDDITDFHNDTSLPLLLIWHAGLLPGAAASALVFALIASAYGFSQTSAKTNDGYFLGFPSDWNAIAFYLYFMPGRQLLLLPVQLLLRLPDIPPGPLSVSYGRRPTASSDDRACVRLGEL